MRLHKNITVSGAAYMVLSESVHLDLFTPGRAIFTLESRHALSGIVVFSCGYKLNSLTPFFIGYVENSTVVDKQQQRIFCRELSSVLYFSLPLALRDVMLKDVLNAIGESVGIEFSLPDKSTTYYSTKIGAFYNIGNGYNAMDNLPRIFGYKKPLWVQDAKGKVFVGSWDDSPFVNKSIEINNEWEHDVSNYNTFTIPAIPLLRPGVMYNGNIVSALEFSGLNMTVTHSANPWNDR